MAFSVSAYPKLLSGPGSLHSFTFFSRDDGNLAGTGVASFNDFTHQNGDGSTACGQGRGIPTVGNPNADPMDPNKVYAAGINDLSDLWTTLVGNGPNGGLTGGSDPSLNATSRCHVGPFTSAQDAPDPPAAFHQNICNNPQGVCFQITNQGLYKGKFQQGDMSFAGAGKNSVKVQLVDACPRNHLNNFCDPNTGVPRTDPADERCEDSNRQFDIDQTAFAALTSPEVSYFGSFNSTDSFRAAIQNRG